MHSGRDPCKLRCPALGWSAHSCEIWMQGFLLDVLHLWIRHRGSKDPAVRAALLELHYLARQRRRLVADGEGGSTSSRDRTALWRRCFFMYCKYREALRLLADE